MKISQKQAALLAREIINQLKAKKAYKISDTMKEELKSFISKRNALQTVVKEAENVLQKHDDSLVNIVGKDANRRLYAYQPLSHMIEKIEEKNMPSISDIEDEIILKSMFANEDDMQKFVDAIVAKHYKKLQNKIASN